MRQTSTNYAKYLLVCAVFFSCVTTASAQLQLERELVGAVVATSNSSQSNDNLLVDASFGEPIIGYEEGDLIVTIGFQQTETSSIIADGAKPAPDESVDIAVSAYPNPTVERLVVELGQHGETFTTIRLVDMNGRIVRTRDITSEDQLIFSNLNRLPNANYYLQGLSTDGKSHHLGTVMIVTH